MSMDDKSLIILGRDVSKMPCFRNTYLYGILGGLGSGLAYFLFTSNIHTSYSVVFGSCAFISCTYWIQCRYRYSKAKFDMQRTQYLLQQHTLFEGSPREKMMDELMKNQGKEDSE